MTPKTFAAVANLIKVATAEKDDPKNALDQVLPLMNVKEPKK